MLVQLGLCQTWSETTLLVFPRDGSFITEKRLSQKHQKAKIKGMFKLEKYVEIQISTVPSTNGESTKLCRMNDNLTSFYHFPCYSKSLELGL